MLAVLKLLKLIVSIKNYCFWCPSSLSVGSLYLSKVTGEPIAEHEARQIMCRFGALERVWFCTQTDKEMFRLPEGIWIMFAFFQDCRDAQAVRLCVHTPRSR